MRREKIISTNVQKLLAKNGIFDEAMSALTSGKGAIRQIYILYDRYGNFMAANKNPVLLPLYRDSNYEGAWHFIGEVDVNNSLYTDYTEKGLILGIHPSEFASTESNIIFQESFRRYDATKRLEIFNINSKEQSLELKNVTKNNLKLLKKTKDFLGKEVELIYASSGEIIDVLDRSNPYSSSDLESRKENNFKTIKISVSNEGLINIIDKITLPDYLVNSIREYNINLFKKPWWKIF